MKTIKLNKIENLKKQINTKSLEFELCSKSDYELLKNNSKYLFIKENKNVFKCDIKDIFSKKVSEQYKIHIKEYQNSSDVYRKIIGAIDFFDVEKGNKEKNYYLFSSKGKKIKYGNITNTISEYFINENYLYRYSNVWGNLMDKNEPFLNCQIKNVNPESEVWYLGRYELKDFLKENNNRGRY